MPFRYLYAFSLLCSSAKAAVDCVEGYELCSPPGARLTNTPQIGSPEFQNLFVNIVQSSLPTNERADREVAASSASLCCNALLSCFVMSNTRIPFCYDKFTTNYFLPDGSYGTVVGGPYTSRNGDTANLETGEYTLADGEKGNIYPSGTPDTATLPMPSQFTGTGVGSAVPASSLGREITVTYTTTLPGTTRLGTTVSPSTTFSVVQETILLPTLVSGSTIATTSISTLTVPVTVQGTTVTGVTIAGAVTTVTTTEAATVLTAPTTKKSRADGLVPRNWVFVIFGMLVVETNG
ncbi:hypothetical protein DL98DRAFT_626091 [Cadophora sp. DSE1049]|nr:hypothetical protein DL98DRAFT_626091 [Cadophora sp. DSE1049]